MADIIARLTGLPQFQRALAQIPPRVATRVLRATAGAGARVVRKAVREAAPVGPYSSKKRGGGRSTPAGVLRNAIISKYAPERSGPDQVSYLVVVRKGRGRSKAKRAGDAFYARWVEEGHRIVPRRGSRGATVGTQRARRAAATGSTRPVPYFRPGTEGSAVAATRAMQERMAIELLKVLR